MSATDMMEELRELEEARRLIEEGVARRIYMSFRGGIIVEVDRDYALSFIEERLRSLRRSRASKP